MLIFHVILCFVGVKFIVVSANRNRNGKGVVLYQEL